MNLLEKQKAFSHLVIKLLQFLQENEYEVTLGEIWRPPETANLFDKEGKGIANSLHCLRLAIDINLFQEKKHLTKSQDYRFIGEYWESLSTPELTCCWGGRFGDGNHFSVMHNGVK